MTKFATQTILKAGRGSTAWTIGLPDDLSDYTICTVTYDDGNVQDIALPSDVAAIDFMIAMRAMKPGRKIIRVVMDL